MLGALAHLVARFGKFDTDDGVLVGVASVLTSI
jgi:hypothetical protein